MSVTALFVRRNSVYFDLVDSWDVTRDAREYPGPFPVVAHPPCRGWGRLSHRANVRPGEMECGVLAAAMVRYFGGVLEHPFASKLWAAVGLPRPGAGVDSFGGWSLLVDQSWWGHPAPKPTWLYVCGRLPFGVEACPVRLRRPGALVENLTRSQREATPPAFARWLIGVAQGCVK